MHLHDSALLYCDKIAWNEILHCLELPSNLYLSPSIYAYERWLDFNMVDCVQERLHTHTFLPTIPTIPPSSYSNLSFPLFLWCNRRCSAFFMTATHFPLISLSIFLLSLFLSYLLLSFLFLRSFFWFSKRWRQIPGRYLSGFVWRQEKATIPRLRSG